MKPHNRVKHLALNNEGMTLIEIMIVIGLIGTIMVFVGSRVMENANRAKFETSKATVTNVYQQVESFKNDCGRFPTAEEGLDALVEKPCCAFHVSSSISPSKLLIIGSG